MAWLKPRPFKTSETRLFKASMCAKFCVLLFQSKSGLEANMSSLNDLEFAFAPLRDTVRDLREYL